MPQVGDEEFAYTPEGQAKAQKKSLETGQPVIPTYDAGGRVKKIPGYVHGGLVEQVNPIGQILDEGINAPASRERLPDSEPLLSSLSGAMGYKKGGKVKKK